MPSLPPTPLKDIDTLPDGAPILGDDSIDASASDEAIFASSSSASSDEAIYNVFQLPIRRNTGNFEEEPTRKALAPRRPKEEQREKTDVVDMRSSWDNFRSHDSDVRDTPYDLDEA